MHVQEYELCTSTILCPSCMEYRVLHYRKKGLYPILSVKVIREISRDVEINAK